MEIMLNGKKTKIVEKTTVLDLVEEYELTVKNIIIELNGSVIQSENIAMELKEGDLVEIICILGGG